jgi:predicted DNA binding protein
MVSLTVPTEQFALAETFASVPTVEFDAVRVATHGTDRVVPLLWATKADADEVLCALRRDGTTTETRVVARRNHDALFRMRWTDRVRVLTHVLVAEGGAVVSASGTRDAWTFRVMFPDRSAIASTHEACQEYDVTIERIVDIDDAGAIAADHLTDQQYDTVKHAVDTGYYEVPRETKLTDLATESSVSHQALSERLRRGHRALIESVVLP